MIRQTERPRVGDPGARLWRWAWVVAVFVWPIFAHGCHSGDHDDELAVIADRPARPAQQR